MKKIYSIMCFYFLAMCIAGVAFGQDGRTELYQSVNQWGSTNIWLVPGDTLRKAPAWKMGEEPPLSPGKAVKIAKNWVTGGKNYDYVFIMGVSITAFGQPGLRKGIYYYNILIGGASYVGHFDRCIILMDGTIVNPEILGAKQKHTDVSDFDE